MNTFQPVSLSEPALAPSRFARQRRVVAFTLIELLVVIAIIGVLAGLIVGLSGFAARKMKESRIRTELNALVTQIESYHARFGHYPKDNVVSKVPLVVNPVTNALFYELSGTVLNNTTGEFRTREGQEIINAADIQTVFNMEGFVNSSTDPKQVKSFMTFRKKQYEELFLNAAPDVELLVVPVPWPLDRVDQPTGRKGLNPWRYVSTSPINNPTTFDLWAEYVDGKRIRIICNWSKDILEKQ
jgi:prepilin-type N-terminal cleavage/methylation domain-containing protein